MHFSSYKFFSFIAISCLVHASVQSEDTNRNSPVIDLAKKCLDYINQEEEVVAGRNGSYGRLTEIMRSYLIDNTVNGDDKIYSFCRQKKQANFDDKAESVYKRGEHLRSEEQRYRLIKELYLAKMHKKIDRLNNLPKCSLTQRDKDLEMHNDKQIVFKFFDNRLQEVIILCKAIAQEYSACVTKPGIVDKYPNLFSGDYESHCVKIEACIDKLRSVDPISEGLDCTIENESERNCDYLHSLKSLIDLLNIFGRELINLKKELAGSSLYEECLVALQKMLLLSEYLKAYDSSRIYFAIQIKFLGSALKEEQSPLYIFKAIDHMKDELFCQARESRRAAFNLSQDMAASINNGVCATPNTDIYHILLYIRDALRDTNIAKCFDDLITTFHFDCSTVSEPQLNPQKKVCCVNPSLPRQEDYIAAINTFYKLAIEENARQSEKKLIDAEIANTLIHLKFAIFELKNAIFLLKSTSEKKMCLQYQNLVNSLSDKIQNAFGTANALVKKCSKDDMLYNDSRKLIIDVLTRQTTGLLQDKASTWDQGSDSSMMQETTDEFTMATDNPPKYPYTLRSNSFMQTIHEVDRRLTELCDARIERLRIREADDDEEKSTLDEQMGRRIASKKPDQYIVLKEKANGVNRLLSDCKSLKTEMIRSITNDTPRSDISYCFDEVLDLLNLIIEVYEEDMNIIEFEDLLKLLKDQKDKYRNNLVQKHQIAILAMKDIEIINITAKLITSYTMKEKLIEEMRMTKERIMQIPSAIHEKISIPNVEADNKQECAPEIVLQKDLLQIAENMKKILDNFEMDCIEKQAYNDIEGVAEDKGLSTTTLENVNVISFCTDLYFSKKYLLCFLADFVSKNEGLRLEYEKWFRECIDSFDTVSRSLEETMLRNQLSLSTTNGIMVTGVTSSGCGAGIKRIEDAEQGPKTENTERTVNALQSSDLQD